MYRIDSSVREPEVWVQVVETQRYYSHECDLMMEIRFDFEYLSLGYVVVRIVFLKLVKE